MPDPVDSSSQVLQVTQPGDYCLTSVELKHRAQRKAIDTVWNQWLAQKPECKIMRVNEDVLEFMVEQEKMQGPLVSEVWGEYANYISKRIDSVVGSDWRKNSIG